MDLFAEEAALVANRASLYAFLARLFRVEVDQKLLDQMAHMQFDVEADEPDIAAGYRLLAAFLERRGANTKTDLAVDYAKVFLGAGVINGHAAFPFESVYTSPDHLVMQDARDQVLQAYRAEGLGADEEVDFPEDHISLELEFMAYFCRQTHAALLAGDGPAAAGCLAKQKDFLQQHLMAWVPDFCADILEYAQTDFYRGAAQVTRGYLHMEQELIEDLIAATQASGAAASQ